MSTKSKKVDSYSLELLNKLPKGTSIYGLVRSVSASGMSRKISFLTPEAGKMTYLTHAIGEVAGYQITDYHGFDALSVKGCGMDMIFSVVYNLGVALHQDGYYFRSEQL